MPDKDALKVWDCILLYQGSKAWDIYQCYNYNDSTITNKLMGYADRGKYHGHRTADSTQGTAGEAKKNQDNAITWLLNNAPPRDVGEKKAKNTVLERQGRAKSEKLYEIIKAGVASGQSKLIIQASLKVANNNEDVTNKKMLEDLDRRLTERRDARKNRS